jgi:glucose-1-phosphate thymidylyltransferase
MKGIILSGGLGTRLHPLTLVISKQLLPVYDKPMIYYPLSCLLLAGIREILIISTPRDTVSFKALLGDGSSLGCKFVYEVQEDPSGLPQAFVIGEKFIGNDKVALILGDNIFHDSSLGPLFRSCNDPVGGTVFAYQVSDPSQYGVVEFDKQFNVLSIEEKPKVPKSKHALVGVYFFDNDVIEIAKGLKKSARNEYEIIDVCLEYLRRDKLNVKILSRGTVWLDSGTFGSLMQASNYVQTIEERQGLKIGCIEEIAFRMGYINADQLRVLANSLLKSGYGQYLLQILNDQ